MQAGRSVLEDLVDDVLADGETRAGRDCLAERAAHETAVAAAISAAVYRLLVDDWLLVHGLLVLRRLLLVYGWLLVLVGHELVDRLQEQRDLVLLLLEAECDLLQVQQPLPGLLVTVARGGLQLLR